MAQVTFTVPDALVPRLTAAVRGRFPQHDSLTSAQAFKKITADYWRGVLRDYEGSVAAEQASQATSTAYQAAVTKADTDGAGIG